MKPRRIAKRSWDCRKGVISIRLGYEGLDKRGKIEYNRDNKMNEEAYEALKRIVKEVKEKRNAECAMKDCIVNHWIGGDDIQLIEGWISEVAKEYENPF